MKGKLKKTVINILFTLTVSVFVAASLLAIIYGVGTILSLLFNFITGA